MPALPPITEAEFRRQVLQWATACGWRWIYWRPARTARGWRTAIQGDRGFPDLVLCRRGVLLIVELKTDKGKYGEGQEDWLACLRVAHHHTYTWRPSQWPAIERLLKDGPDLG